MDKKFLIIGITVLIVVIMLVIFFNKNDEVVEENELVKDPNIVNFYDEETGYYVIYEEDTGAEIARVKTEEEIEYYETHQNEIDKEQEEMLSEEAQEENITSF